MADYYYLTKPSAIKDFFEKIKSKGIPSKVDEVYFQRIEINKANGIVLSKLLKSIGFITEEGLPTEKWEKYKANDNNILATSIKEYYSEIIHLHTDLFNLPKEKITAAFKTFDPKLGDRAILYKAQTFRALSEVSGLILEETISKRERSSVIKKPRNNGNNGKNVNNNSTSAEVNKNNNGHNDRNISSPMVVNLNVQITLPSDISPETIDAIFSSMKKHLKE